MTDQPDHHEIVQAMDFDLHDVRIRFRRFTTADKDEYFRIAIAAAASPIDEAPEFTISNARGFAAGLRILLQYIDAMHWGRWS